MKSKALKIIFIFSLTILFISLSNDSYTFTLKGFCDEIKADIYYIEHLSDDGYLAVGVIKNTTSDVYIEKFDKNLKSIFKKTFSGDKSDFALNAKELKNNNIIICGISESKTFNNIKNSGNNNNFILCISPSGDPVWTIRCGNSYSDRLESLLLTENDTILISGRQKNPGKSLDIVIHEYSYSGELIGTHLYGSYYDDYFDGIIKYNDGYLIFGRPFSKNSDVQVENIDQSDTWIAFIDKSYKIVWQSSIKDFDVNYALIENDTLFVTGVDESNSKTIPNSNLVNTDISYACYDLIKHEILWRKVVPGNLDDVGFSLGFFDSKLAVLGRYCSNNDIFSSHKGNCDICCFLVDKTTGEILNSYFLGSSENEHSQWVF